MVYCSRRKYEYFCTTGNKNFECFFLKKYFVLWYLFSYYYFVIFYFLYCSIDPKYEYFCTTCNKNFICVFLESIFFKLVDRISHVLVDWLTWNLEIFIGCTFIARTTDFKIWCFFYFFFFLFTTQKTRGTRKIDTLTSKCCHLFNSRNFAVSVVQVTAIFAFRSLP